ncbi:MAG: DUF6086 family protein [Chloroflexaceae bacterium]|nr:DUF6086 family protein [Chloroflexaceae bacterium]
MGFDVRWKDQIIWETGHLTGSLFWANIQVLEQVKGIPSGITQALADELEIDLPLFRVFVSHLIGMLAETNSPTVYVLLDGTVQVCLALEAHLTGTWPTVPISLQGVLHQAKQIPMVKG